MKKNIKSLAIILIIATILPGIIEASPITQVSNNNIEVERISGRTRVEIAIEASKVGYKEGTDTVILAGYNGEVDALTGTLLANNKKAPLLLTSKKIISKGVESELKRLNAKNIILLGGNSAISKEVERKLKENYKVDRVDGSNRGDTALKVANRVIGKTSDKIFLARGYDNELADALAIGPVSARDNIPVLLTQTDRLPETTKQAIKDLQVKKVTIIGGYSAISKEIEQDLKASGLKVVRKSGSRREDTARKIAEDYFESTEHNIIASGWDYADALVGGYLGSLLKAPVLLTRDNKLSPVTKNYLKNNTKDSYILGGEKAVKKSVFKDIETVLGIKFGDTEGLEVHFLDVGQGDSIFIKKGENTMLIDAGERWKGEGVVDYIKGEGVNKIDYVIGTHPHADHIGGLIEVVNSFDIGEIMMPDARANTEVFEDLMDAIKDNGIKASIPNLGDEYELGNSKFTILAPNGSKYSNTNNYSIVTKLEFRNNSFLFTGDAEKQAENEIIEGGYNIEADVLKLGHHGSKTSTNQNFLDKVNPDYAVIQVGQNNRYNHPNREVLDRLKDKNIKVYRNDLDGTVIAKSDGKLISFHTKETLDMSEFSLNNRYIRSIKNRDSELLENENYRSLLIDRFEGDYAVGETNKGELVDVLRKLVPNYINEGDNLEIQKNKI